MRDWTLKKEMTIGDLIAFGSAALAIIYSWSTLNSRIAVIEQMYMQQAKLDARQDEDLNRLKTDVKDELKTMNGKLDKLLYRLVR